MPAPRRVSKYDIPPAIQAELLRLQLEEGLSDGQLSAVLKDKYGIIYSRPSVNRLLIELRKKAGKPAAAPPVPDVEVEEEPDIDDETQLERTQRNLFRAQALAYRAGDIHAQVKAAQGLVAVAQAKRRIQGLDQPGCAPAAPATPPMSQAERDQLVKGAN